MRDFWKKITLLALLLMLVLTVCGCGGGAADGGSEDGGDHELITVTDHNGNEISLRANPQRIVVCDIYPMPSILAVFFDSAEKIAGMSSVSLAAAQNGLLGELYPEILDAETGFINDTEVNLEELLALEPDVVFYSSSNTALGDQLAAVGVPAVAISSNKWDYDCIETLNQWIALLSQIFPENDRSEKVKSYSERVYNMVSERVSTIKAEDRKNVFFLFRYDETSIMTSGKRFFGNWWAEAIGGVNVGAELDRDNAVPVNLEQVYDWNPDVIFITNFTNAMPEDLYENSLEGYDWSGISAVKDRRVYKMPLGMYRSYTAGVDAPVTLLWMAKSLYPQLFEDVDVTEYAVDYYRDVFGVELTKAQAESIFKPAQEAGDVF